MRNRLGKITLKGFKTIKSLQDFEPGPLTTLIGPNGVGKSNFISFFRMMSWALADPNNLPLYVGQQGGAGTLLHDGSTRTREIETELTIRTDAGENQYAFRLVFAAGDTLIFADERYRFSDSSFANPAPWTETDAGHRTPRLLDRATVDTTARVIRSLLQRIVVYQFHNTSDTSRVLALVTLLLQPEQDLPDMLILDEPELGLHPYAINVVGGLISGAAAHIQVIVATQSTLLVDCFEPEDVVVVEREGRSSAFKRLDTDALKGWLEDYSLSELWQKNVIGGRP